MSGDIVTSRPIVVLPKRKMLGRDTTYPELLSPQTAFDKLVIGSAVITTAMIQDLAVITGKIANLAVTNAKINDLDATKITAGYLSANRIEAGSLDAKILTVEWAKITNAIIEDADIVSLNAAKLTAGNITVTIGITTGKLTSGSGNAILDSSGLTIKGQLAIFQDSNGVLGGYVWSALGGGRIIIGGAGEVHLLADDGLFTYLSGAGIIGISAGKFIGDSSVRFSHVFGDPVLISNPVVTEGCLSSSGGADGILYVYASGAWRLNDVG